MEPVSRLPVDSLSNRIVGTRAVLRSGREVWATLGNVSLWNVRQTRQFLTVSVELGHRWFHLVRYFDAARDRYGPAGLAAFLGLAVEEVFPISYDISAVARGLPEVVRGKIPAEPEERLSEDELMRLTSEEDEPPESGPPVGPD